MMTGSCPENDEIVGYLEPKQFSSYQLQTAEYFDFSEFRDSSLIQDANPTFLLNLAKEVDNEGHDVDCPNNINSAPDCDRLRKYKV